MSCLAFIAQPGTHTLVGSLLTTSAENFSAFATSATAGGRQVRPDASLCFHKQRLGSLFAEGIGQNVIIVCSSNSAHGIIWSSAAKLFADFITDRSIF